MPSSLILLVNYQVRFQYTLERQTLRIWGKETESRYLLITDTRCHDAPR